MSKVLNEILKMQKEREWKKFHTPENLSKSISIESAELLECFQWNNEYNLENVKDELADVLNYCFLLAHELDLNVEEIMLEKIEKNKLKYPVEKAKGSSKKYTKL